MRCTHYLVIILLLFAQTSFGQIYQNMAQPGYKFSRARFDSVLSVPVSITSLRNISGGRDTGQIRYVTSDSSLYVYTGRTWVKFSGGSAGMFVDSVTVFGDSLLYWKAGASSFVTNLANGTAGGDTTIFEVVLDSTGQQNNRLLFSKNNKISSSPFFLADPTNRKIVIGNANISTDGASVKLSVTGATKLNGSLNVTGPLTATGVLSGVGSKALRYNTANGSITFADTTTSSVTTDTTSLSNRINLKLNIADTIGNGNLFIRNTTTQENKRFNVKGGRLDTLYASTSAGGRVVSNGGTIAAEWGAGGGSNFDFHGFAGYNANRASSYTTRSFTDKNYVDSAVAVGGGGTDTTSLSNRINLKLNISDTSVFTRKLILANRQTASYTLALTDQNLLVELNVGSGNTLTVPLNSSVAFTIGTKIDVAQYGAGQTTITATGGVTIRSYLSQLKIAGQYGAATLVKIGTDEWYCFGNLTN
jgi:hypothetical protein